MIDNSAAPCRPTRLPRGTSARDLRRELAAARRHLAAAEAALTAVAERDHELRNIVAGLAGALSVLGVPSEEGGLLLGAARAELARLQQMLDGPRGVGRASTAVGPVLRDLATVHRASGMDVRVSVDGDPAVAVEAGALAQVVANLLVNCARHAPGAPVRIRARRVGGRVRVEVADAGPGLPHGAGDPMRRGARGPRSTGSGLGLAITADLLRSRGGTLALRSSGRGATAVVELPFAPGVAHRIAG